MSANPILKIQLIDFDSVRLLGEDSEPEIVTIKKADGFFLNHKFSDDFRIRKSVYDMMNRARARLPGNYSFMIYEAYRPLERQIALWDMAMAQVQREYPKATKKQRRDMAETFVADPYNGIGSGHQACCAIDVSLCDKNGREYDMGTQCQEISPMSPTASEEISDEAKKNRCILVEALEAEGLVNYPSEWWHFSYGDHQWAFLLGKVEAFYGPLDI